MSIDIRFGIDELGEFLTEYVVSGWSIAPGESISGGGDLPIGIGIGAETGQFTATAESHPEDRYVFDYTFGNAGLGVSAVPVGVQIYPGSFPSGHIGNVIRLLHAPRGRAQELGSPTGFEGVCAAIGVSANAGVIPSGFAGSLAMLLLGGRAHTTRSLVDQLVDSTLRNVSPLLGFINEFKYATFVWATGLATPNAAAGGTISLGLATRA
jgi:hypothetical protein